MTIELLDKLLLWSTLINFGILLLWFSAFMSAHDLMYKIHNKLFGISGHRFNLVHYSGMLAYKLITVFFNLVPYVALQIILAT